MSLSILSPLNSINRKRAGKKRTKSINELSAEVATLNEKYEQYSRGMNCLLTHSVPEDNKEDTDAIAAEFFNTKMDVNIRNHDIDCTHRIGKKTI